MKIPTQPLSGLGRAEEIARLQEIAALGLLSEKMDPMLQAAVNAAAREMNLPTALVSIVLDDVQYFVATGGLNNWSKEAKGTPLEWSFCLNVVRTQKPFVVEDAMTHPLMKDSPLVQLDGIRCYAGIPLTTTKGHALGSFCVMGTEARQFTDAEIDRLKEFGHRIVIEFEKRRPS